MGPAPGCLPTGAPGLCDDACVRETFNNQRVRVVVADDHPLFRDGLVRALSGSGLVEVVAEAEDGPAALALIKEHRPDVALVDHQMPGMDGAQVAAAVQRDELPTRVLLVSANTDAAIVYHALQQGAAICWRGRSTPPATRRWVITSPQWSTSRSGVYSG